MGKKKYIIDKGVERVGPLPGSGGSVYAGMQVGDSVAHEKGYSARSAAKTASERYAPAKFESGVDASGAMRVWRIA